MRRALAAVFLVLPLFATAQSPTGSGPSGELRAKDHAPTFQLGEVITLEASFTSQTPNKYLEPCELLSMRSFGYPQCRFFNPWSFSLQAPDGTWTPITEDPPFSRSGPTIDVPDHDLSTTPVTFTYVLTQRKRFESPGKYTVRLTTQIALDDDSTSRRPGGTSVRTDPPPHMVPLTLDYAFTVVPANAEWQRGVISRGVEALEANRSYRDQKDPGFHEDAEASAAICNLHTPDAAIALARVLADGRRGDCIVDATDRTAAAAELRRLLADPNVGVTQNFLQALASLEQPQTQTGRRPGLQMQSVSALEKLGVDLFQVLPQKIPKARLISLATVLSVSSLWGWLRTDAVPQHLSDAMIQAAAENFVALPETLRNALLDKGWERIRSPLLLATVQHEAEGGNGQAVLDWQDLDPTGANQFIRAEIVSPIPRFYAYYLQLPEATLPDLEAQLIDNMIHLPPGHDLGPSATLVARYATVASLPTVLPFYDQHATEWPCSAREPLLAYLLRVSPKDAAPRLEAALADAHSNKGCNTYSFFTELGVLHPSPVLEDLAFQQIQTGSPWASDAAQYLQEYGSPSLKPRIWAQLVRWEKLDHPQTNDVTRGFISALVTSYEAAQGWVLSPEESDRLRDLLGAETIKNLSCNFSCGHPISVAPGTTEIVIYRHDVDRNWMPGRERIYLWPATISHLYSINQYSPPTLAALLDKLAQFPAGSTFVFATEHPGLDHRDWIAINDFLIAHGYHLRNPWHWDFLPPEPSLPSR
jgi:hypothetical protein